LAYSSTLKTGTACSSETLEDIYKTTTLHTLAVVSDILEEESKRALSKQVANRKQSKLSKEKLIGYRPMYEP
jgi:hypothetical protein